jgi:histidinol-phosphatase
MVNDYRKELAFAKELAVQAKLISDSYYKTRLNFTTKTDSSPVTIADEEINRLVVEGVKNQFPEQGVLGEEQSWQEEKPELWVCDPIDGTIAFSMGEPTFMFSLALVSDGKPVVAVTCNLATGDLFWAVRHRGAYLNEKQLFVSERTMAEAWLAFPTNLKWLYQYQNMYKKLDELAYQTNVIHGGVFKGMLVAQGLADAVIYPDSTSAWDMAAVKLIVDEAGGKMTDIAGKEHRYDTYLTGGIIISSATIHESLLEMIQNSIKSKS